MDSGGAGQYRRTSLVAKSALTGTWHTQIRYHFAVALVKSGDKAKARKELDTLLSSGKDFPVGKRPRRCSSRRNNRRADTGGPGNGVDSH